MSEKTGLVGLIAEIGNDSITFQDLRGCITDVETKGDESEVSFLTNELSATDLIKNSGKRGFVVWVDDDVFTKALSKVNS